MSTVLILLNNAPEPRKWFEDIYKEVSKNHKVVLAAESTFVSNLFEDILNEHDISVNFFCEYFENNYKNENLKTSFPINTINVWESYFSDFERNELYFGYRVNDKNFHSRLLICLYSFFEEIILKKKIDIILYENISNSFAYVAYNVGNYYKVNYIGIVLSRLKGRFEIFDGPISPKDKFLKHFQDFLQHSDLGVEEKDINAYVKNFENIIHVNDIVTHPKFSLFSRYFNLNKFYYLKKALFFVFKNKKQLMYSYQTRNPLYSSFFTAVDNVKRKLKLNSLIYIYDNEIDYNNYYLYPLHYHPESSTSVHSRHYINELNVITNIAFNLPFGTCLYVKEHPSAAGNPKLEFYKNIKKIPNVYLINHDHNIQSLIKKSIGVITLTSTVGYEALMFNKPVYLFGDVFYEFHPNCRKIFSYDELWDLLNHDLINPLKKYPIYATAYAIFKITLKWDENYIGKLAVKLINDLNKHNNSFVDK